MSLGSLLLLRKSTKNKIIIIFKSNIEIELFKLSTVYKKYNTGFIVLSKNNIYKILVLILNIRETFFFGNSLRFVRYYKFLFPFMKTFHAHAYLYHKSEDNLQLNNTLKIHKSKLYKNLVNLAYPNNSDLSKSFFHSDKVYFKNKNYLVFSVGSGPLETHKRWIPQNYTEVIDYLLKNTSYSIIFIGSSSDSKFINSILESKNLSNNSRIFNLVRKTSLDDLISIFMNAILVIGTDNGLLHLANSCNSRILAMFGPTNKYITGPTGEGVNYINLNLSCSPCYLKGGNTNGCGYNVCLENISSIHIINFLIYEYGNLFYKNSPNKP